MGSTPRRRGTSRPGPWAEFGRAVAERRHGLGLTQRQLADLADVSLSTVQELEAGRRAARVDSLHRILRAVGWALAAVPIRDSRRMTGVVLLPADPPDGLEP